MPTGTGLVVVGIAFSVCAGCTSGSDPIVYPSGQTVLIQQAIAKGDAAAVVALYLEDAQIIPPDGGESVKGRTAIQVLWQGRMDDGLQAIEFSRDEIRGEDDMRFETGTYTSRNTAGEIDVGKFFTVWRLVDRSWFVSRHTWASDLEDAAAPATVESDVAPQSPPPETATE